MCYSPPHVSGTAENILKTIIRFANYYLLLAFKSTSAAVVRMCSVKKVFLEISQNSQENTCAKVSFLIKLHAMACNFIKKENLAQVCSCEFLEIS